MQTQARSNGITHVNYIMLHIVLATGFADQAIQIPKNLKLLTFAWTLPKRNSIQLHSKQLPSDIFEHTVDLGASPNFVYAFLSANCNQK